MVTWVWDEEFHSHSLGDGADFSQLVYILKDVTGAVFAH